MDNIEIVSDLDFEASFERLIGCLTLIKEASENPKWKTIFDTVVFPFTVGVLSGWVSTALPPLSDALPGLPGQ